MIYRGSNVDLDEFKKTFYVPCSVDVFERRTKSSVQWNWLKQRNNVRQHPQRKSPRITPGAFLKKFRAATGSATECSWRLSASESKTDRRECLRRRHSARSSRCRAASPRW